MLVAIDDRSDSMRLNDPSDRDAFRQWFTFLADIEAYVKPDRRPAEIVDCAALLRFAYREALRNHDSQWAADAHLPLIPALPSVQQYAYPHTPLGASIFCLRDGRSGQFADAETIRRYNTFLVGRDVTRAEPGDLLFYFRAGRASPAHSMIFIGHSHIEQSNATFVVYDTGPDAELKGDLRRRTLEDLLHYRDTQWRPQSANPYFLGVYRWNILR